jgi:hypothetical protein
MAHFDELATRDAVEGAGGEAAQSFWEHGLRSHLRALERSYKTGFKYSITLSQLGDDMQIPFGPAGETLRLNADAYYRLHIHVRYTFRATTPAEIYSAGCVFRPGDLPHWFQQENFLLRELVEIAELRDRDLSWISIASENAWELAENLFRVEVRLDDQLVEPEDELLWDEHDAGIRWTYRLTADHWERLARQGLPVSVKATTYQPKQQHFFPANITTPTKGPTIEFSFGGTGVKHPQVQPFFSSNRPYGESVVTPHPNRDGVTVELPSEDWALMGDGCVFIWDD